MRANRFISEEEFTAMEKRVRGGVGKLPMTEDQVRNMTGCGATQLKVRRNAAGIPRPSSSQVRNLAPSPYFPYVNKWELNFGQVCEMEKRAGAIKSWKYAGITFTLAHRQYHRIDFIIGHNDRSIEIAQVKGYHPNMRAAIKGLKWAAQLYPMFTWTIKWWTGTGWDGKYVEI